MKRFTAACAVWVMILAAGSMLVAQNNQGAAAGSNNGLSAKTLEEESTNLDKQVAELATRIQDVVKKYDLMKADNVTVLPYRMAYDKTNDSIFMERHRFIRESQFGGNVIGIEKKSIRIFTNGQTVSKFEVKITRINYNSQENTEVIITDPSPTTAGTNDIIFTHTERGRKLVDNMPMSEIRNTTAFPVQNEIKRGFYIPTLTDFYDSVLTIAETYQKGQKDDAANMNRFMQKSTDY